MNGARPACSAGRLGGWGRNAGPSKAKVTDPAFREESGTAARPTRPVRAWVGVSWVSNSGVWNVELAGLEWATRVLEGATRGRLGVEVGVEAGGVGEDGVVGV